MTRLFILAITLCALACSGSQERPSDADDNDGTRPRSTLRDVCPSFELEIDLSVCETLPNSYGHTRKDPLEWGSAAQGDDLLWYGRLMCHSGATPAFQRQEGDVGPPPEPSDSAPSELHTGFGEVLDAWTVTCPEQKPITLYTNIYRCGNPCPPQSLTLINTRAATALREGLDIMSALERGTASAEQAIPAFLDASLEAHRHAPDSERVLDRLGFAYLLSGQLEEARDAYQGAADINPRNPYHTLHLAWVAMEAQDADRYRELVQRLLDITEPGHPLHPEALCRQAGLLQADGESDQAREVGQRACDAGAQACCP